MGGCIAHQRHKGRRVGDDVNGRYLIKKQTHNVRSPRIRYKLDEVGFTYDIAISSNALPYVGSIAKYP
jgi:hypothetical protein